jgi:hypothetical protein
MQALFMRGAKVNAIFYSMHASQVRNRLIQFDNSREIMEMLHTRPGNLGIVFGL